MRRAFIIGSNGPVSCSPLKYAKHDAERISEVLQKKLFAFETDVCVMSQDVAQLRTNLFAVADACIATDTFLCYFSGHGFIEKGELWFLLDETNPNRLLTSALPVSDVLKAMTFCKARSKLLILDCCHAGAVVSMVGLKDESNRKMDDVGIPSDTFLILMASGKLEKARELDIIKGGFLTHAIISALDYRFGEADLDSDGSISIEDLKQFIEFEVTEHNRNYPKLSVPMPELFGRQKGAFYFNIGGTKDWIPYEFNWPNHTSMVVLPVQTARIRTLEDEVVHEYATCMSKFPVTNWQYQQFMQSTGTLEPEGKEFINGRWQSPFLPMQQEQYNHPNQPVVCVSFSDACEYCNWLNNNYSPDTRLHGKARLPNPEIWDFAAMGQKYPAWDPASWLQQTRQIHHSATAPAQIDTTGERTNRRGISDMIGNVWEWCNYDRRRGFVLGPEERRYRDMVNVRGGGFLDTLEDVPPILSGSELKDGENTKHTDLGFRIICRVRLTHLPEQIQYALNHYKLPFVSA